MYQSGQSLVHTGHMIATLSLNNYTKRGLRHRRDVAPQSCVRLYNMILCGRNSERETLRRVLRTVVVLINYIFISMPIPCPLWTCSLKHLNFDFSFRLNFCFFMDCLFSHLDLFDARTCTCPAVFIQYQHTTSRRQLNHTPVPAPGRTVEGTLLDHHHDGNSAHRS